MLKLLLKALKLYKIAHGFQDSDFLTLRVNAPQRKQLLLIVWVMVPCFTLQSVSFQTDLTLIQVTDGH